jgi:enamine deaminase RidA (YjgF/YER057c/UK114 family)
VRAVYTNIQRTLAATGLNFDHVVKETIYTTDMDALLKSADVRLEFYSRDHLPATAWVQVQRLIDPGFMIQVDVIAVLP